MDCLFIVFKECRIKLSEVRKCQSYGSKYLPVCGLLVKAKSCADVSAQIFGGLVMLGAHQWSLAISDALSIRGTGWAHLKLAVLRNTSPEAVRPFASVGQIKNYASRSVGTTGEAQPAEWAGCRWLWWGTAAFLLVVTVGFAPRLFLASAPSPAETGSTSPPSCCTFD